jgi:hypothetical protein
MQAKLLGPKSSLQAWYALVVVSVEARKHSKESPRLKPSMLWARLSRLLIAVSGWMNIVCTWMLEHSMLEHSDVIFDFVGLRDQDLKNGLLAV